MANGPVGRNPYLLQVLFQNLSSADVQPGQVKNSANLISSAFAAKSSIATISANGSKINNVNATIRASGDLQAYEGFQAAVSRAGSANDPTQLIRLSTSANFIANSDSTALTEAFAALGRNLGGENNALTDGFNAAFAATVEKGGSDALAQFNRGVAAVEKGDYKGAPATMGETLQKFYSLSRQINAEAEDSQQAIAGLSRLARGIELADNGSAIWNFFDSLSETGK